MPKGQKRRKAANRLEVFPASSKTFQTLIIENYVSCDAVTSLSWYSFVLCLKG